MKLVKSLKGTIILSISAAAILPVLVFGLLMSNLSSGVLKTVIEDKHRLITKTLVSRIEEYLNHPYEDLSTIKDFLENNPLIIETANNYLQEFVNKHEFIIRIQIADKNGLVTHVAPFNKEFIQIDVSGRKYFQATQKTKLVYWSSTFLSGQFNQPVISLSLPLNEGVITAYISLDSLTKSIKNLEIGSNSYVSITDQTATYVAHFDTTKVFQREHDPYYDLFKSEYSGEIMTKSIKSDNIEWVCHVSFIKSTQWAVNLCQSKDEILAPVQKLYAVLAFGALIGLFSALIFSFRYTKSINKAISRIMNYTSGLSKGNYDLADEDLDYSEFIKLGENFKTMSASIKSRENTIRESENTFRAIFNSNAIGATIIDSDYRIVRFNQKWLEIIGYQSDEISKLYFDQLMDGRDKDRIKAILHNLSKRDAGNVAMQFRMIKKDGSRIWIEQHTSIIKENTKAPFIINMAIDITARKNADLERSRLVSVIEQTTDYIIITDTDGDIEYVNPAFERGTGYSRKEVFGRNPRFLKSGAHDEAFYQNLWKTVSSGKVWAGQLTNKTKEGNILEEDATIFPVIDSDGSISNYVGVKRDITHQKEMELKLQQSQKMEAIGTLAGGIAHDFNNIISALSGYARLARGRLDNKEKLRHYIDQIDSATHRAGQLVGQILTFSRKSDQQKKPILYYPIVKEALKFMRSSIPATIEIKQSIQEQGYVLADPTQIHQIIMNLATNAYHAMQDKGGILSVGLQEIEVSEKSLIPGWDIIPGVYLKLSVTDTGHGIPNEIREKIFEPYFTTKNTGEGTGLGLAMVHGIVKSYNGFIDIQSTIDVGTEVGIYLPKCEIPVDFKDKDLLDLPVVGGSEHIAVVDDEEPILNIIDESLTQYGYSVTVFKNAKDAFESIQKSPGSFDLLLTDLIMPHMTGIELIERVRVVDPHLPTILCSGHTETMNSKKAISKGINAYLQKPFQIERLASTIRTILDESKIIGN